MVGSVAFSAAALADIALSSACLGATPARTRRTAITAEGILRGYETDKLAIFKGVHYGENTANSRFQPPVPVRPWKGVRDAVELGSPCYQDNIDPDAWQDPRPESEDCLVLNIWAPKNAKKAPVMVWIHGGGFWWGSGGVPAYDGTALAERGEVVVVTLNHRLNAFGYLYLGGVAPEFSQSANLGQLDIVEALHWIRRNISAFGGDPESVTIFGESGGGAKVSTLLAMPAAKGLLRRAIVQSGSLTNFRSLDVANQEAREFLAILGLKETEAASLTAIDPLKLKAAYKEILAKQGIHSLNDVPLAPVLDGRTLPYQPSRPEALALWEDVPLLVGTTEQEAVWLLSLSGQIPTPPDDETLARLLAESFGDIGRPRFDALMAAFRKHSPGMDRQQLLVAIGSTLWMIRSAVAQADTKAALGKASVHYYRFDWKEPFLGALWALHGSDVGFVFGTQDLPTIEEQGKNIVQDRAKYYPHGEWYGLRDATMESWLAFAKSGNPNNALLPQWPPYSLENRSFMRFNASCATDEQPLPLEVLALLCEA